MKVLHIAVDKHCVFHMHHGKSIDVSILDLGRVYVVWNDILSEISNISISVLFFLFSSSSLFALHAAVLLFLCCLFMF
jgi:hypothetical protein